MSIFESSQRESASKPARTVSPSRSLPSSQSFAPVPLSAQQTPLVPGPHSSFSLAQIPIFSDAPQEEKQLQARIQSARTGGQALQKPEQQRLGQELGADLSGIRLHTDGEADRLANTVDAAAFTTGQDIFFQQGIYNPTTPQGFRVLIHELTHTLQQPDALSHLPPQQKVFLNHPEDPSEKVARVNANRIQANPWHPSGATGRSAPPLVRATPHQGTSPATPTRTAGQPLLLQRLPTSPELGKRLQQKQQVPDDQHFQQIFQALDSYHQRQKLWSWRWPRDQQFQANQHLNDLDNMEHQAYQWLAHNKASFRQNTSKAKQSETIMDLLDEIQQAHTEHIDYMHRNNLKLATPDRGTLSPEEQARLDQTWDQLRNGTGSIKLPDQQKHVQLNKDLRAMHARLLSRPVGRQLLSELLAQSDGPAEGTTITFTPQPEDTRTKEKLHEDLITRKRLAGYEGRFNALAKEEGSEQNNRTRAELAQALDTAEDNKDEEGALQIRAQLQGLSKFTNMQQLEQNLIQSHENFRAKKQALKTKQEQGAPSREIRQVQQLISQAQDSIRANEKDYQKLDPTFQASTGDFVPSQEIFLPRPAPLHSPGAVPQSASLAPGSSSLRTGANIEIRPGITDSQYLNLDKGGDVLPSPAFILYGHELIHALHYKQGTKDKLHPPYRITDYQHEPVKRWTKPEEHQTIESLEDGAISENSLRKEHNMPSRGAHNDAQVRILFERKKGKTMGKANAKKRGKKW